MVDEATHGAVESVTLYSILEDPMTSCGCFECICGIEPVSNGVMDKEDTVVFSASIVFSNISLSSIVRTF